MLNENCGHCKIYKEKCKELGVESMVKFTCGAVNKEIFSNSWNVDCMNGMIKEEEDDKENCL